MEYILENFSGPLDLLLQMLSKNKIKIEEIFVSNIIDQFLSFNTSEFSIETSSEFAYISSKLLYIKSKRLLPKDEKEAKILEEEFILAVENYKKIKEIVVNLAENYEIYSKLITKPREIFDLDLPYNHNVSDLVSAFENIAIKIIKKKPPNEKDFAEIISLEDVDSDKITEDILVKLEHNKSCDFTSIISDYTSKMQIVVCFLSLLQLCRQDKIMLLQKENDIKIILK